ncbi:U32 family peptidase, partial [uncultured Desulfovibrio sp.]
MSSTRLARGSGRSGNKGHCTQPCRWSYALVE